MSRKLAIVVTVIVLAAVIVAAAVAVGTSDVASGAGQGAGQGAGAGQGQGEALGTPDVEQHVTPDTSTPLTAAEADGLTFMREEEKLARDVYTALGAQYELPVFSNIARSESTHMAAVKDLLDAFSIPDPVGEDAAGRFEDDSLAALYAELMDQGGVSLEDALRVGIAIEEKDIADLEARIAATDREDLKTVYESLLRGSERHLQAFTQQLDRH